MTTIKANNVFNIALDGNFDDCQAIVKKLLVDIEFNEKYNLASINSIIAGAASGGVYAVYWGVFAVATYVIYIATAATGYIIIKSGNHYLTPLMNSIVGYGLLGLGPIFLVLGLIWKVNTEIGYRIFNVSQILWVILILILGINILISKKK